MNDSSPRRQPDPSWIPPAYMLVLDAIGRHAATVGYAAEHIESRLDTNIKRLWAAIDEIEREAAATVALCRSLKRQQERLERWRGGKSRL